jgi:DDB1- and CUL4-associated factor 5
MLHDGRAESRMTRAQGTLQQAAQFSGAFFHPHMEHLFATSDVRGNVRLRDTRMAFGPLRQRTKEGIVLKVIRTRASVFSFSCRHAHCWSVCHKDNEKIGRALHPA